MIQGLIAGSFDVIHPGYIAIFDQMMDECDEVVVFLHTDPTIERPEKCKPILSVEERMDILGSLHQIDCILTYTREKELYTHLKNFEVTHLYENNDTTVVRYLGDDAARAYVRAADDTTDNAGFIPTTQSTTLINGVANGDRGFVDALSRETLAAQGMTFELPRINTAPTVALTNEAAGPSETDMATAYISVDVKKFAGQQTVSVELIDRSSPAFFSELVRQMEFAYSKATDAYAVTRASATATASTAKAGATAANYLAFFANAAKNCYTGSLGFARNVVVSPDVWAEIMGLNDNGRPIYIASNPQNAGGALSPLSIRGNVAGLDLYVSRSLSGTGDGSIYVINPDALTFYESPRLTLQTNVIASGQISVMYYGYAAVAPKLPDITFPLIV